MWRRRRDEPVARELEDERRVDRTGLEQLVGERPPQLLRSLIQQIGAGPRASPGGQAVAVRVQPAGGEPDAAVALLRRGADRAWGSSTMPTQNPARSYWSVGHHAGMLGRLAAEQGAAGARQPSATPVDERAPPRRERRRPAAR